MYEITRMRDKHRKELVKNIRQVDAEEIWAYSGRTAKNVMDELEVVGRSSWSGGWHSLVPVRRSTAQCTEPCSHPMASGN